MDIGDTQPEPSWIFPGSARSMADPAQAAAFLDALPEPDRNLFVLAHGLALDLGTVAYAMHLDSSIVSWRLRRSLMASEIAAEPGELERGVRALFTGDEGGRWDPRARLEAMPASVRKRLAARLASHAAGAADEAARSSLGIGAVAVILLAMIGFMAYGVIQEEDPMWRGKSRVRQGQYSQARNAFRERGNLAEARVWTAITWLAEGNFGKANEVLDETVVKQYLASFRPVDSPLEPLDVEAGSSALLPRGLITIQRPEFVFMNGSGGELVLEEAGADDAPPRTRPLRVELPESAEGPGLTRIAYPSGWPALEAGTYMWSVPGNPPRGATFTVMSDEERHDLQRHTWQRLSHDIPLHARSFLRGHYYLRSGLYMQAGNQFRDLAEAFPDEPYPLVMLDRIGAALGVDPTAFLR